MQWRCQIKLILPELLNVELGSNSKELLPLGKRALSEENFCYFENVSELMIRMEKIVVNQRHHDS